jgi:hypothetical protein
LSRTQTNTEDFRDCRPSTWGWSTQGWPAGNEFKGLAYQALNYCLYAVNDDGCPNQRASNPGRGGWQEDAHTDKLHNILDAIAAFPEWAD